jgi:hypothetical protein
MITNLQDLSRYIRATIPYPQSLVQLQTNQQAGGVTFIWTGTEFFVKTSLHVLEVRGHSLFITGLSTLLQSVLMSADNSAKKFDTMLETLNRAEDLIRVQHQVRAGAQLLGTVRHTLEHMVPRSEPARMAA